MRSYRLAKRADRDLVQAYSYGFERFGEQQADEYHVRLQHCFKLLADQPGLGRSHHVSGQQVRVFFHESHVIVYLPSRSDILIVRVLSMRQNWRQILGSR